MRQMPRLATTYGTVTTWLGVGRQNFLNRASVSPKGISRVEWKSAIDAQDLHGAIDGVDINDSYGARCRVHGAQYILIMFNDFYKRPSPVEFGHQRFYFC